MAVYGFIILGLNVKHSHRTPKDPRIDELPAISSATFDKETSAARTASIDDISPANIVNRVWIARFYTPEGNDDRTLPRREAVAARIREEYRVQTLATGVNDNSGRRPLARGVFQLVSDRLFSQRKVVVWQQFMKCAYAVILDDVDTCNVFMATSFLSSFIAATVEHFGNFGVFESPVQFYQRPEDMFVLLHKFLPQGHMWYTRGRLLRKLVDEAEAALQVQTNAKRPFT